MQARGVGEDPLVARFRQAVEDGVKHRKERIARGEPLPPFVDNPTPTELFHRRSIAISDESRVDGDSSGE